MSVSSAGYHSALVVWGVAAMRVRVKICGIARPADAEIAAQAGADALGLVFYAKSPRCVDTDIARDIVAAAGPFVTTVALFVNPSPVEVERVIQAVRPSMLQFHGEEPAEFCERFGLPYLKAVRVGANALDASALNAHPRATGLLLDTLDPRAHGGTGRRFDWSLVPQDAPRPLVVAGGLDAGNVEAAIDTIRPWAVDVSSGVESAPGRKEPGKIHEFMRAVARANAAGYGSRTGADVE